MIEQLTTRTEEEMNREMRRRFHLKNADFRDTLKVVYTPILFYYAAFDYVAAALEYAALLKLPYKSHCRGIKEQVAVYKAQTFIDVQAEVLNTLLDKKDEMFSRSSKSLDNLWTLQERYLKKHHPDISEDRLVFQVNVSIALLLLRRALRFEASCERTHMNLKCKFVDEECVEICILLVDMQGRYAVPTTASMIRSLDAIERKVDNIAQIKFKLA